MSQAEIIAMAKEAGATKFYQERQSISHDNYLVGQAFLERFAALVAAKEREACAKVCESTVWTASIPEWRDMTKRDIAVKSMLACAAAIRARGQKGGV